MKKMKASQSGTERKRIKTDVSLGMKRGGVQQAGRGRSVISRRRFLGASAASGAVLLGAGWTSLVRAGDSPAGLRPPA